MENKKIIVLALALLIIAGVVVVCLKGFNVDFMLKQHDSIEYKISDDFELSDVENICKDVFGDKKFKIRVIELFNDAVSINAENITKEEAKQLNEKLDEKYKKKEAAEEKKTSEETNVETQTTETTENAENTTNSETTSSEEEYKIISNPKIKLFSLVKPYIYPVIISGIVIMVYEMLRYKKLGSLKVLVKLVLSIIVSVLAVFSVIAITRIPVNVYIIPVVMAIVLLELILFNISEEKKLKSLKEDKE